jgi:hypothetical protein
VILEEEEGQEKRKKSVKERKLPSILRRAFSCTFNLILIQGSVSGRILIMPRRSSTCTQNFI